MFFDLPCTENVSDPISTHKQGIRNQLPVTSPENSLRAAIHGCLLLKKLDQFANGGVECGCLHVIRICAKSSVLPCCVQRRVFDRSSKPAETLQMNVFDPYGLQRILQVFEIELRGMLRTGQRTNVHEPPDFECLEYLNRLFPGAV